MGSLPRWTPEKRSVVDRANPASGSVATGTSVVPRSIVITQASRVGILRAVEGDTEICPGPRSRPSCAKAPAAGPRGRRPGAGVASRALLRRRLCEGGGQAAGKAPRAATSGRESRAREGSRFSPTPPGSSWLLSPFTTRWRDPGVSARTLHRNGRQLVEGGEKLGGFEERGDRGGRCFVQGFGP
jgi:hypothetical protein